MKSKVLVFCLDRLSASMAGPAIRYWELAKALSQVHDVTLATHFPKEISSPYFQVLSTQDHCIERLMLDHDVIIIQEVSFKIAYLAKRYNKKIILDNYDPLPIEILEHLKHESVDYQRIMHRRALSCAKFSLKVADRVICASPVQKNFWIGLMTSLGLINPETYHHSKLANLEIVPFGLSSTPPKKQGKGLREHFNFLSTDFVMIWGGGIWNWFDPLTLIRALHSICKKRSDIKLVFMGTKHPNPGIPEMQMTRDAIKLAKELNLFNQNVFFNEGWVPYDQRQNYLLDADLGISTHFSNLETIFSFRTRLLDYLWAGLPIITSQGDFFADLVKSEKLGIVVEPQDQHALENAILWMADQPEERKLFKQGIERIKPRFYWEEIAKVIHRMIADMPEKSGRKSWSEYYMMVRCFLQIAYSRMAAKAISWLRRLKKQEA